MAATAAREVSSRPATGGRRYLLRAEWQPLIDQARNGPQEDPVHIGVEHIQRLNRQEREERVGALRGEAGRGTK